MQVLLANADRRVPTRLTILLRIYDQKYFFSHFCRNMQPLPFILLFLAAADLIVTSLDVLVLFASTV
jgi:hypothetical protein